MRMLAAFAAAALAAPSLIAAPPRSGLAEASARAALEKAYDGFRKAMLARDADAVIAQRTDDFRAITPDGAVHDASEMAEATRSMLGNLQKWELLSYDIVGIERNGDELSADIRQHSIRLQRRGDGNIHRIENWVSQRETWVATPTGLKVRRVDNIRDQNVLIDGKPR